MHMADALLSPEVAVTMDAISGVVAIYSVKKIREENDEKKIPVMGVMGAFVFASQMINFTIPMTGSSGHLCGGMLLAALLGPYGAFLTMISVLLIQCLMFADGGLLALGANIFNMAFYGCFIGYFIWKMVLKNNVNKKNIFIASILGSIVSLELGAISVSLQTYLSNITELPFQTFILTMMPIHLAIGLVEGVITGAVLSFIYETRPRLLNINKENKMNFKKSLIILTLMTLLIGGGLSLYASSSPDGLEWSILKVSGKDEITSNKDIYKKSESIQNKTSLLPDYSFKNNDSSLGTSFSGIAGSISVLVIVILICIIINIRRKNNE